MSRDRKSPTSTPLTPSLSEMGAELVGAHEIAEMFGVSRQAVHNWLKEPERWGFPEPLDRIKAGLVWRTADVMRWAEEHGREIHGG